MDDNANKSVLYLKIKVAKQGILIPLQQIHLILPNVQLQDVPHDNIFLAGFINYHGQPLPVYHLSELIQTTKPIYDLNTPILLGALSSGLTGFFVSDVLNIMTLSIDDIKKDQSQSTLSYVEGFFENEQESAWILDLEKLLQFYDNQLKNSHARNHSSS